jgi:hypothetical protein
MFLFLCVIRQSNYWFYLYIFSSILFSFAYGKCWSIWFQKTGIIYLFGIETMIEGGENKNVLENNQRRKSKM